MNTMQIHQYRTFYKAAKAAVQKWHDDYDAEVNEWYENGDGRSPDWQDIIEWVNGEKIVHTVNVGGRGYRFPSCIHGMSLWTDYDNICGGCEDSLSVAQEAAGIARSQYRRFMWVMSAPSDLPSQYKTDLVAWMIEANRF